MNQGSGVKAEDVQYAICMGQDYGGKKWSDSQEQEACQRYEAMTGEKVNTASAYQGFDILGVIIVIIALLAAVGFVLYRIRSGKNTKH